MEANDEENVYNEVLEVHRQAPEKPSKYNTSLYDPTYSEFASTAPGYSSDAPPPYAELELNSPNSNAAAYSHGNNTAVIFNPQVSSFCPNVAHFPQERPVYHYMPLSCLVLLLNPIAGIIAIIYSRKSMLHQKKGELRKAEKKGVAALYISIAGIVVSILVLVVLTTVWVTKDGRPGFPEEYTSREYNWESLEDSCCDDNSDDWSNDRSKDRSNDRSRESHFNQKEFDPYYELLQSKDVSAYMDNMSDPSLVNEQNIPVEITDLK